MLDLLGAATRLSAEDDWFTLTKVVVRVGQSLGGYLLDIEGLDILDELRRKDSDAQAIHAYLTTNAKEPDPNKYKEVRSATHVERNIPGRPPAVASVTVVTAI